MERLRHSIREFHKEVFPTYRARFEELASGQQPETLLITCSDSRIVPQLVTQCGPGELFVLRNAGNLVPPYSASMPPSGEAATIEYAVNVLRVEQIVVCGHSQCGAISGLLNPESTSELPAVRDWLTHAEATRRAAEAGSLEHEAGDQLTAAVQHNVAAQLDHLRSYPFVAEKETQGELTLVGWYYRFETGDIFELNAAGQFVNVLELSEKRDV